MKPFSPIKYYLIIICLIFSALTAFTQKPKDGTYTYIIRFAEWNGKSLGATCTIIIKGDSVIAVHNGRKNLSGKKGDIIETGLLMKHRSGKWIIGHKKSDKDAKEIGGCSDAPMIIDLRKKVLWSC